MNKISLILFVACLAHIKVHPQALHGVNWVTQSYYPAKINFSSGLPQIESYSNILRFHAGASCISDSFGRLRLVCDGYRLWDSAGVTIEGGDTISPKVICEIYDGFSSYSQSSIILPFGNDVYSVICSSVSDSEFNNHWPVGIDDLFDVLSYTIVDMKANGGMGKVLQKALPITGYRRFSRSQMTACRHADGESWWLLKQGKDTNRVYKFVLNADGIYDYGFQEFGAPFAFNDDHKGQSSISHRGQQFSTVVAGSKQLFIADFNRCDGYLSNPRVINIPEHSKAPGIPTLDIRSTGVCFSPNDSFLYVLTEYNLYQLDLFDPDSNTAWYHVANMDTVYSEFQKWQNLYRAPDNRIYVGNTNGFSSGLSYIAMPDKKGANCQFCARCLHFPQLGVSVPPNMPNYALGKDTTLNCWPMGVGQVKQEVPVFHLYPNPASSSLTIESEGLKRGKNQLQVYNLMGQLLLQEYFTAPDGKYRVAVHGLPDGVYMVRVNGVVRRLVIE